MHIASTIWRKVATMSQYNTGKKVLPASRHADFLSERSSRLPPMFSVLFPINTTEYTFSFTMAERNQCSGFHQQSNAGDAMALCPLEQQ